MAKQDAVAAAVQNELGTTKELSPVTMGLFSKIGLDKPVKITCDIPITATSETGENTEVFYKAHLWAYRPSRRELIETTLEAVDLFISKIESIEIEGVLERTKDARVIAEIMDDVELFKPLTNAYYAWTRGEKK